MSTLDIYLLTTVIPNIDVLLSYIYVPTMIIIFFLLLFWVGCKAYDDDSSAEIVLNRIKTFLIIWFISISIAVFIPSREDLKIIVAGNYLTNVKGIDKLPENTIKFLNKYFEEETKENK